MKPSHQGYRHVGNILFSMRRLHKKNIRKDDENFERNSFKNLLLFGLWLQILWKKNQIFCDKLPVLARAIRSAFD